MSEGQKRGSRKGKVNLQMVVPVWTMEGQRERRMMWKTLRTQRYSKKAPAKLIKSL